MQQIVAFQNLIRCVHKSVQSYAPESKIFKESTTECLRHKGWLFKLQQLLNVRHVCDFYPPRTIAVQML